MNRINSKASDSRSLESTKKALYSFGDSKPDTRFGLCCGAALKIAFDAQFPVLIRRRREHHVEQPRAILRKFVLGQIHQREEPPNVGVGARVNMILQPYRPSDTCRRAPTPLLLWNPPLDRFQRRPVKRRRTPGHMRLATDNRCWARRELTRPARSYRRLARSLSIRMTRRLRCAAEDKIAQTH